MLDEQVADALKQRWKAIGMCEDVKCRWVIYTISALSVPEFLPNKILGGAVGPGDVLHKEETTSHSC
jgi:hypothetical protein